MSLKQACRSVLLVLIVCKVVLCFDVNAYCRSRCLRGSGGPLCQCTKGHFSGKRSAMTLSNLPEPTDESYDKTNTWRIFSGFRDISEPKSALGSNSLPDFLYQSLPNSQNLAGDEDSAREGNSFLGQESFPPANTGNGPFYQPSVMGDNSDRLAYPYLSPNSVASDKVYSNNVLDNTEDRLLETPAKSPNFGTNYISILEPPGSRFGHRNSKWAVKDRSPVRKLPYLFYGPTQHRNSENDASMEDYGSILAPSPDQGGSDKFETHPNFPHLKRVLAKGSIRRLPRKSRSTSSRPPA